MVPNTFLVTWMRLHVLRTASLIKGKPDELRTICHSSHDREGGLIIEHDGEQMRMSVEDVKQITPSGKFHKAKFAGNIQSYQLCDITWKPSNDDQKEMF